MLRPFASHEPTSTLLAPASCYLYAILASGDELAFDLVGVAGDDGLRTVACGELSALIGDAPVEPLAALPRAEVLAALTAHQAVLERVAADMTLLPVAFGTVLADEDMVRAMLADHAVYLMRALARYTSMVQIEIVVMWEPAAVFAQIAAEPRVATLRSQAQATRDQAVAALGQLVKERFDARRTALAAHAETALGRFADTVAPAPLMDECMVYHAALLLDQQRYNDLDVALDTIDAALAAISPVPLKLRCVGPLPPHSFATVAVSPIDPAAVADARTLLALPRYTSAPAVRQAYRARAAQLHPDRNAAPDAAAQLAALVAAQRLLLNLGRAYGPALDLQPDAWNGRVLLRVGNDE